MKRRLVWLIRTKIFQGIWEKLFHFSKIGMNYWGGACFEQSGEIYALNYVKNKLKRKEAILVFDVGANKGDYSLLLFNTFGSYAKVYSFEPSRFTFDKLVAKTTDVTSIFPVNIGFGERNEKVNIYAPNKGSSIASIYGVNENNSMIDKNYKEEVVIETIDGFCEKNNIESVDFIKIDVEGHELSVLKGAEKLIKNKKVQFIQFEFGEFHMASKTFFKDFYYFFNNEYTIYRIVSNGLRKIRRYSTDLEVFNTSNFLAELK